MSACDPSAPRRSAGFCYCVPLHRGDPATVDPLLPRLFSSVAPSVTETLLLFSPHHGTQLMWDHSLCGLPAGGGSSRRVALSSSELLWPWGSCHCEPVPAATPHRPVTTCLRPVRPIAPNPTLCLSHPLCPPSPPFWRLAMSEAVTMPTAGAVFR